MTQPRSKLSASKPRSKKPRTKAPVANTEDWEAKYKAAHGAGLDVSFRFGKAMEELEAAKGTIANLRVLCNKLEAKQRDLDNPPVTLEEHQSLLRRLSYLTTQSQEYVKLHEKLQLERNEAIQALKDQGPSLLSNGHRHRQDCFDPNSGCPSLPKS